MFPPMEMLLKRFISDGQPAKVAEEDGKRASLKENMQTETKGHRCKGANGVHVLE